MAEIARCNVPEAGNSVGVVSILLFPFLRVFGTLFSRRKCVFIVREREWHSTFLVVFSGVVRFVVRPAQRPAYLINTVSVLGL